MSFGQPPGGYPGGGTPPPGGFGPPPGGGFGPPPGGGFGPPPPGYGPPYQAGAGTNAIVAFVLALCSWFVCPIILAIPAMILAKGELRKIEAGESSPQGKVFSQIAWWMSIVNLVIYGGFACLYLCFVVVMIVGAGTGNM